MPDIVYGTPPGGGFRVDVPGNAGAAGSALGGGGAFGPGIDLSWITDFAKQQAMNKLQLQDQEISMGREAARGASQATRQARLQRGTRPRVDPMERALKEQTITTELAKQQAMRGRGPQRYIFGLGYAGGPNTTTPDVSRMSGIERQIFLPQAAGMDRYPSRMEAAGADSDAQSSSVFARRLAGVPSLGQEYANRGGPPPADLNNTSRR